MHMVLIIDVFLLILYHTNAHMHEHTHIHIHADTFYNVILNDYQITRNNEHNYGILFVI
jgi:hypothetical protein